MKISSPCYFEILPLTLLQWMSANYILFSWQTTHSDQQYIYFTTLSDTTVCRTSDLFSFFQISCNKTSTKVAVYFPVEIRWMEVWWVLLQGIWKTGNKLLVLQTVVYYIQIVFMGINNYNQIVFKATSIVFQELDCILEYLISNKLLSNHSPAQQQKQINCDISNIIHILSHRHSCIFSTVLVRDVALFLKQLASDTGYVITAVLDGNICPQSKQDVFQHHYTLTMNRINSYFCRQSTMKLALDKSGEMTNDKKKKI